jgi:hypothetical protein
MAKAEDKREGFVRRIRPHAEWEAIRWGWDLLRSALIPLVYLGVQKARHSQTDWIGLAILFALCFLIGFLLFPSRHSKRKKEEPEPIARDVAEKIVGESVEDAKRAGGQAAMLWNFAATAKQLTQMLEEAWNHWNDVGERLIHPLDARLDSLKDHFTDYAQRLLDERRHFMVLYSFHLSRLRLDFPGFRSAVTQNGYPSDTEYVRVLNSLREHSQALDERGQKIWDSELPDEDLSRKDEGPAA